MLSPVERDFHTENDCLIVEGLLTMDEAAELRRESHQWLERLARHVQMRDPTEVPVNDEHRSRGQGTMLRGIGPATGTA